MAQAKSLRPITPLQKILAFRSAGLVGAIRTVGKVGLSHIAAIPAEEVAKVLLRLRMRFALHALVASGRS